MLPACAILLAFWFELAVPVLRAESDLVPIVDEHAAITGEGSDFALAAVRRLLHPGDRITLVRNQRGEPKCVSDWAGGTAAIADASARMYCRGGQYGLDSPLYDALQLGGGFPQPVGGSVAANHPGDSSPPGPRVARSRRN